MTTVSNLPTAPIPAPLRAEEPGTFTEFSVIQRLPDIGRRTIAENDFHSEVKARLQTLIAEIPESPIRPLEDSAAPDWAAWQAYIRPHLGQNWLQAPWFFVENYFYRRILEATGYFIPGPYQGFDPYTSQKRAGLETGLKPLASLVEQADAWARWVEQDVSAFPETLTSLLNLDLWGNQVDLSLWPVGQSERPDHTDAADAARYLLVDDRPTAALFLAGRRSNPGRVDLLADNAGFELGADLCLLDFLLRSGAAAQVRLHLKLHPTFVSDALIKDARQTIDFLGEASEAQIKALGQRLKTALEQGQIQLVNSAFWNSPLALWEMPAELKAELGQAAVVLSKGDAHYRRALGDRHWAPDTPLASILSYFPAPLLLMRTLKSEVVAGLKPGQAEAMLTHDPDWEIDGRWGVIQWNEPPEDQP